MLLQQETWKLLSKNFPFNYEDQTKTWEVRDKEVHEMVDSVRAFTLCVLKNISYTNCSFLLVLCNCYL